MNRGQQLFLFTNFPIAERPLGSLVISLHPAEELDCDGGINAPF